MRGYSPPLFCHFSTRKRGNKTKTNYLTICTCYAISFKAVDYLPPRLPTFSPFEILALLLVAFMLTMCSLSHFKLKSKTSLFFLSADGGIILLLLKFQGIIVNTMTDSQVGCLLHSHQRNLMPFKSER